VTEWRLAHNWETGSGVVRWASFGEGPPLVLLHGTPFSSFIWRDVAPVLARNHTVHVWDMLGFGESDKDASDVSLATQTTIFCGLLRHWGVHRPRVIAHDVGGVVALRAALLGGVDFSDLTLIDAASVSGWGSGGFFQTVSENPQTFSQLPDWATDALIAAKIQSGSHLGLRPEVLRVYLDQWGTSQGRQAFYRQYAQGGEEHTDELQSRFSALSMPIHVIWGRNDQWLGLDYAHRLLRALPADTRFDVIDGAGHMVPEDRPGALLSYLAA
jgi:pimeloyl-ACP methyl ester carboxylesterase